MKQICLLLVSALILSVFPTQANASEMREAVSDAISILSEKQSSERPIPAAILRQAKAIGVIEVTKGAFGVGGADGEGVILVKTSHGWSAPVAFTQGGGSIGFQIGVSINKFIYVFNTDAAWKAFTGSNKVRFQAAAEATAGPDSYTDNAAQGLPFSNLYVYTLSDGAFAGAAIGGQSVAASDETNSHVYQTANVSDIVAGRVTTPNYVHPLYDLLHQATK